jgi:hypothetical protein
MQLEYIFIVKVIEGNEKAALEIHDEIGASSQPSTTAISIGRFIRIDVHVMVPFIGIVA